MTQTQASMLDRTEEDFLVELKSKTTLELCQFISGPWTASILSPNALDELYRYLKMRLEEETPQQEQENDQAFIGLD